MAEGITLTHDRFTGEVNVVANNDGSMEAYNPYTGYMVQAPSKKALLAFGMKETKRHLEGFDISPKIDFLYDAAGAMTLDGTVIQSTYGVMCFKVVKKLFVEQVENYWVDRHGNIRSNIELAQCIRDQFKSRDNLYVAVSPYVIKKIS